jgi:hypothetical protein
VAGVTSLEKMPDEQDAEYALPKLLDDFEGQGRRVGINSGKNYAPSEFAKTEYGKEIGKKALGAAMRRLFEKRKTSRRIHPDVKPSKAGQVALEV